MIRYKWIVFIIFYVRITGADAQNAALQVADVATESDSLFIRVNTNLYALGTDINDNNLRQEALANLLSYSPRDTFYLYRLLDTYFSNKQYLQSFLLAKKYLPDSREDIVLLSYFSKSAEVLGKFGDAVTGYKKLYILTDDVYYGYLNASAISALGKFAESNIAAKQVLAKFAGLNNSFGVITFSGDIGKAQSVPVKAALFDLMGLNYLFLKDKPNAREALLSALKEFPDFEEARENLAATQ